MVKSLIKKIGISDGILNGSSLGINIVNTMLLATHFQDSALVLFSGFTFLFCAVFELPISYWADRNGVRLSLKYAYFSSIIWVLSIITANYIALNKIQILYYPSILFYSISCALSNAFYKGTFQTAYLDWYYKHSKSEDYNLFVNSFPYSVKWKYAIPTFMLLSTILLRLFSDHSVSLILVLIFITIILRFYTTYRDLDLSNASGDKLPSEKKLTISRLISSTANTRPETGAYAYSVITRNFVQAVLIAKCCIFMGPLTSVSTWITGIFVALGINYLNLFVSAV
ncbi:MAG: hypothetical protein AB8G05_24160, partial [Oligoflexales bacterium]